MDVKQFYEKLKNGDIASRSSLDLRNESKQVKGNTGRIPFLKKEKGKLAKLLVLTDIVLPFNPFTGEEDNEYNKVTPFRPELSAGTVIKVLKEAYQEDKNLKEKVMKRLEISDWDTSNSTEVTKKDMEIFDRYRKKRIFTHMVVNINSKTLTRSTYGQPYRVNFKRDEFGEVIFGEDKEIKEYPLILSIQSFYYSIFMEEYKEWEQANLTSPDKVKDDKRRSILAKCPVSKDYPKNFVFMAEVPYKIEGGYKIEGFPYSAEDIKSHFVVSNYGEFLQNGMNQVEGALKSIKDKYPSFYELDLTVPDVEDDAERGRKTTARPADACIAEFDGYKEFADNLDEAIDNFEKQEIVLTKSAARNQLTDETVSKLCNILAIEIPLDSIKKWITNGIADQYTTVLSAIYGDDADELLVASDLGELAEGRATEEEIKKSANEDAKMLEEAQNALEELEEVEEI